MKEDFGPTSLEYEDALGQFAGMEGMGMGAAGGMGLGGDEQAQTVRSHTIHYPPGYLLIYDYREMTIVRCLD